MLCNPPVLTRERCASNRTILPRIVFPCAILVAVSAGVLLSTGCGGAGTTNGGTNPTSPGGPSSGSTSNSSLTVSNSLPAATVGSGYSATVSVTGGIPPYTFAVVSGGLPQGLGLAAASGTISGTPGASGNANFALSVADSKGVSKQQSFQIAVSNATTNAPVSPPSSGKTLSNLQHSGGWQAYGQQGPNYVDCSPSPCNGVTFWMGQGISNPSISGEASGFSVGGTAPYSDALFNNHLIGPGSSQGLPDTNQALISSLHDFTYDVYFYGGAFGLSQALEFDINQFFNSLGLIFGHQCRLASGNEWDVFDNQNKKWVPTGIPCYPQENSWNHLTLKVQRNSNDELVYQSITFNGQSNTLNWVFPAGSSSGWYGLTTNYQMDGDAKQDSYTVYLDQMTLTYQ